jgi:hypothetical protein
VLVFTPRDAVIGCVLAVILALTSLPIAGHAAAVSPADSTAFGTRVSDFTLLGRARGELLSPDAVFTVASTTPLLLPLGPAPAGWMRALDLWASRVPGAELAVQPGADLQTVFDFYGVRFDPRFVKLRALGLRDGPGNPYAQAPSVVPLPAALWLFASAAGLLGWRARRKEN